MDIAALIAPVPFDTLLVGFAATAIGGFVKGAVGFALPMVALSTLGMVAEAQLAVVLIVLPTFVTNVMQMLREGPAAMMASLREFWRMNLVLMVLIGLVAQLVPRIPSAMLFVILGVFVSCAAALQLAGWRPPAPAPGRERARAEWLTGTVAGVSGGLSGVWGPPVTFLLLALDTPKREMVRVQGIAFFVGATMLVGGHLVSGLLTAGTAAASALMVLPCVVGMWLGRIAQDRLDQRLFRRATLAVLCLAGLNLLRRGLM